MATLTDTEATELFRRPPERWLDVGAGEALARRDQVGRQVAELGAVGDQVQSKQVLVTFEESVVTGGFGAGVQALAGLVEQEPGPPAQQRAGQRQHPGEHGTAGIEPGLADIGVREADEQRRRHHPRPGDERLHRHRRWLRRPWRRGRTRHSSVRPD